MENEKSLSITGLIKNFVSTLFTFVSDMSTMAKLEAELAKKSLVSIVAMIFLLSSLLTCTWFFINGLIFLALLTIPVGLLSALAIVTAFNVAIIIAIVCMIVYKKKDLSFPATRRQIQKIKSHE